MGRVLRRDFDVTIALCGRDAIDHIVRGIGFDAIVSAVTMLNMTGSSSPRSCAASHRIRPRDCLPVEQSVHPADRALDELGVSQLEKSVTAKELRALRVVHRERRAASGMCRRSTASPRMAVVLDHHRELVSNEQITQLPTRSSDCKPRSARCRICSCRDDPALAFADLAPAR